VLISFNSKKRGKFPRVLRLSVSMDDVSDVNDLMNNAREWRVVQDLDYTRDKISSMSLLALPLLATCLKFQVLNFWEDAGDGQASKCQHCNRGTPDPRSGICPACSTNSRQCRNCRTINYDADTFFCSQCGISEFVSCDWQIQAVPSFSHTRVNSAEDVTLALAKSDELLANAQTISRSLGHLRSDIVQALSQANPIPITERINRLNHLYNDKGKNHSYQLTAIVQHVSAIRSAIGSYLKLAACRSVDRNMCYSCRATYINNALLFLAKTSFTSLIEEAGGSTLFLSFLDSAAFTAAAAGSLLQFCRDLPDLCHKIVSIFIESLPNPSPHVVRLLCQIGAIHDAHVVECFSAIKSAVSAAADFVNTNSAIVPTVVQPLVDALFASPVPLKTHDRYSLQRVFAGWRGKPGRVSVDPLSMFPDQIVRRLLIECSSRTVRESLSKFLAQAASLSVEHQGAVYKLVSVWFAEAERVTPNYEQCVNVLVNILRHGKYLRKAIASGTVEQIVARLTSEVDSVLRLEGSLILDLSIGSTVELITRVLKVFLDRPVERRFILCHKRDLVVHIVHNFFRLRSLLIQRSKYLDDSLSALKTIISGFLVNEFVLDEADSIVSPNPTGPTTFIISALDSLKYGHFSVVQELSNFLLPEPVLLNFPVLVQSLPSQRDYLPGGLSSEPVMSRSIGYVMRDIKNRTCTILGMMHLIDEEISVELLVNGNMIDLDLRIDNLYTKVWVSARARPP
jgi:E3 ubiquitin-protein ligase UBR4